MTRPRLLFVPLSNRRLVALLVCAGGLRALTWGFGETPPVVHQAFLGFIIAAISLISSWLGTASAAVSAALSATVSWLAGTVSWLAGHTASLFKATGGMFSKVWDVSRRFWGDVIRPAFQHVYRWIEDARDWLKKKLGPVFKLITKIRARVQKMYDQWVRPILDGIETTRHVLQVLAALHVKWAAKLDQTLAEWERAIVENYLLVLKSINRVTDVLNSIVTGEMLFQRVPFLASLRRDTPQWVRMFWNAQVLGITPGDRARLAARAVQLDDPAAAGERLTEFYQAGGGDLAPVIEELVPVWHQAAGLPVK